MMTDTCVFCGTSGTNFRPEHWVPKWVSRATIPEGKGIEHHAPGREPWLEAFVDLRVDHVCSDCNHGWMSDLETKVRNIALPLIDGDMTARILSRRDLDWLARWCFLKAITLELGRPPYENPTYPGETYSGFKRIGHPPLGCVISLGLREIRLDERPIFVWFKSQGQKPAIPPHHDLDGYRMSLTIKHLVIDVAGVFYAPEISVQDSDDRLLQIWPFRGDIDWPPSGRFTGIVNDQLV